MAIRDGMFFRNSSYAILSNLLNLIVSTLVVLILPRIIGVTSYGYWQLYLFYVSYVGFGHLGWIDGIYLKFGGQHFDNLDRQHFFSQFVSYNIFQFILAILVFVYFKISATTSDSYFIVVSLAFTLFLTNVRFFLIYVLQTTNLIKLSSMITIVDRLIYVVLLFLLIFWGQRDYRLMIVADIIGRLLSLLYATFICRTIVFHKLSAYRFEWQEILDNIKVGSNLMLSNVASMLIIGTVRLGIEKVWDVATFGKVSLTLSISSLMMTFINAIGIVIFPMLKRMREDALPLVYQSLRQLLLVAMFGLMLLYFPLRLFLGSWLTGYEESLKYMVIIFPMSIFEGKMSLLINTYFKAYRMEKTILKVNVITMLISVVLTLFNVLALQSLNLAVLSIVLLMAIRSSLAEVLLARRLQLTILKRLVLELSLVTCFVALGWFLPLIWAFVAYSLIYVLYAFMNQKALRKALSDLKIVA